MWQKNLQVHLNAESPSLKHASMLGEQFQSFSDCFNSNVVDICLRHTFVISFIQATKSEALKTVLCTVSTHL